MLGLPFVNDSGTSDGAATIWLLFGTGPSEIGVHPTRSKWGGQVWESTRDIEFSFMCDDVVATRSELEAKGAVFDGGIVPEGWGLVTSLQVPGCRCNQPVRAAPRDCLRARSILTRIDHCMLVPDGEHPQRARCPSSRPEAYVPATKHSDRGSEPMVSRLASECTGRSAFTSGDVQRQPDPSTRLV